MFENDVKIYGIQTSDMGQLPFCKFENDVKIYGIQTMHRQKKVISTFENDVKIYGIQTYVSTSIFGICLRMM